MIYIKSPIFYMGNKYRLLPQLIPLFPARINTFYDLFGGSGCMSANVKAEKIVYNEINENIVELYKLILKYSTEEIDARIREYIKEYGLNTEGTDVRQNNPDIKKIRDYYADKYMSFRKAYNESEREYLMLYTLTFYSFSNLIRFNGNNDFNMPYGNRCYCDKHYKQMKDWCNIVRNRNIEIKQEDAFNILQDAEEHIKNLNNLNIGCIRIGTPSHIGVFYLSNYIADFRKIYPGIKFEIVCKSTSDMVEMLEMRNLDLIVDTLPINSKREVTKVTLSKLHNCFAYNKNIMKDVNIEKVSDLKNYPLILPSATSSIRLKLDEYMESQNTKLMPIIESWTTEMMIEMVRKGVGIGYFVESVIDSQDDKENFEVIRFNDDLPAVDVCCVYIDDFLTTATRKFVELITSNKVGD